MNEIKAFLESGLTVYAILLRPNGEIFAGEGWETIIPAHWVSYDIPLTEECAGIYYANLPAVAAGSYTFVVYERAGGSPAATDVQRGIGSIAWDGTAETVLASAAQTAALTLGVDFATVTAPAVRSLINAARREFSAQISGNTLSVYKEDDETVAWSATLVRSASAQPVVGVTQE